MYLKRCRESLCCVLIGRRHWGHSSEDERMDHPTQMQARLKGWIIGERGIDERQDGCTEQGMKRWKSGWWNEWRSREEEQRTDVMDVIQLVFITVAALCVSVRVCMYHVPVLVLLLAEKKNYWSQREGLYHLPHTYFYLSCQFISY